MSTVQTNLLSIDLLDHILRSPETSEADRNAAFRMLAIQEALKHFEYHRREAQIFLNRLNEYGVHARTAHGNLVLVEWTLEDSLTDAGDIT